MKNVVVALPDQQTSFLSLLDLVDTVFASEEKGVAIFEQQHLLYYNESFRKLQESYFISEAWIIQQSQSITGPKTVHNEWKTCELTFHRIQRYIVVCIKPYQQAISPLQQLIYRHLFTKNQLKVEWVTADKLMKAMKKKALAIKPPVVAIYGDAGTGKHHWARWLYAQHPYTNMYLIELDTGQLSAEDMRCILQQLLHPSTQMQWLDKQYTLLIHHIDQLPFDIQWMIGELLDKCYPAEHILLVATLCSSTEVSFCQGRLCEKLYDYFDVSFKTTALAERPKDIPLLISHYLHEAEKKFYLTSEALAVFQAYGWPGNVAELYQLLAQFNDATVTSVTKEQAIQALPASFSQHQQVMSLADVECALIQKALEIHGYSLDGKKQAADALCISLSTLYNKMKTYNL